jgi:hypothetical protein
MVDRGLALSGGAPVVIFSNLIARDGGGDAASLNPSPLWGGWHIVSVANDVTGGGSARQCAKISLAEAAPRPTGLRTATLPTRGRDKGAAIRERWFNTCRFKTRLAST